MVKMPLKNSKIQIQTILPSVRDQEFYLADSEQFPLKPFMSQLVRFRHFLENL